MLTSERLVMATIAVNHERVADVRSQAFAFEKVLGEHYLPANVLPIPDSVEGVFPRITYASKHGHSQIACSQVSMTLNVQFSLDWQTEHEQAFAYLRERLALVEGMLSLLPTAKPLFTGIVLVVNVPSTANDAALLAHLHSRLQLPALAAGAYDVEFKTARVLDNRFFLNTVVRNYRSFPGMLTDGLAFRMPSASAVERGAQIIIDLNDRYSFNEQSACVSDQESRRLLIEKAPAALTSACLQVRG